MPAEGRDLRWRRWRTGAGSRVRAWCHGSRDPPAGRDREPVCEPHDSTGEPGAGNRHAGFGERGEETYPWESACGPARKRRKSHRPPTDYAPPLDSTPLPQTTRSRRGPQGQCVRPAGFGLPFEASPGSGVGRSNEARLAEEAQDTERQPAGREHGPGHPAWPQLADLIRDAMTC